MNMATLNPLAKFFFDMCLLKEKPQDLPNSLFLLQLLAFSNFLVNVVINIAVMPPGAALYLALVALALVYGLTRLLLSLFNVSSRLRQTLIAIFGTELVIAIPAVVLRYWFEALDAAGGQSDVAVLLWMLIFIWSLVVTAHIFRHSLGKPFGVCVAVSVTYTIIIYNIMFQAHTWLVGQA